MPEKGDWRWEFDTTGGTQKITQSKENVHNYAPSGKTAPDYHGAIGVTDDSVEGCEIVVPQFKWTETHQLDADEVTWDYSQTLYDLTGKTNADDFRGFSAGQVLFHGGKGSQSAKNPDLVEMTFSFAASRDASGPAGRRHQRHRQEGLGVPLGPLRHGGRHRRQEAGQAADQRPRRAGLRQRGFFAIGDRLMTSAGGNKFAKVRSGDRRILPADVWNAMLDTVEYVQGLRESGGALTGAATSPVCVKPVKNTTGSDLVRFAVVGVDSVLLHARR